MPKLRPYFKKISFFIRNKAFIALAALILFHLVNNYFWISRDSFSFHKDVMTHLSSQLNIFYGARETLHSGAGLFAKFAGLGALISKQTSLYGSPLFYSAGLIINLVFGYSALVTRLLSGMFYLSILVISVFLIGRKIKGEGAGLMAALIISFSAGIFGSSRMYGPDLALTAMVSLSILFLLLTENLASGKYSFIFGLISGITLAMKAQGALFICGPFICMLYTAFIPRSQFSARKLARLLLIAAIACLFSAFFYGQPWLLISHFISFLHNNMIVPSVTEAKFLSLRWFLFYLGVIKDSISLPLTILFIICLLMMIRKGLKNGLMLLFLWIAVPYLLLSTLSLKDESYFFPALPAVALIIAIGVNNYARKIRVPLYIMIFAVVLFNYFVLSYYGFRSGKVWQSFIPVKIAKFMAGSQWAHPPAEERYAQVADDFAAIIKNNTGPGRTVKIGIIEERYFKGDFVKCLEYFLKLRSPEIETYLSSGGHWPFFLDAGFLSQAGNFDYIIAFNACPSCAGPEFNSLQYFKLPVNQQSQYTPQTLAGLIQGFKGYKLLRKNFIAGSCIPVFLMSRQKLKAVDEPAAVCKPVISLLRGKVTAVEPGRRRVLISYQDTSGERKEGVFYTGSGITSYENILSMSDLKTSDGVIIDYYIDEENKKIILNMSVDDIQDIPHFLIEKPSGNLRNNGQPAK
jgi:hypothetical protein